MNKNSDKEFRDFCEATRALTFWARKLLGMIEQSSKKTGEVKELHKNSSNGSKNGTTGN